MSLRTARRWCVLGGSAAAAMLAFVGVTGALPPTRQRGEVALFQPVCPSAGAITPGKSTEQSGDVTSIGVTYFAGRSRGGDDAHLAAALTSELARQLLSARATGTTRGRDLSPRGLLTVRLTDGGDAPSVDLSMTGYVFREDSLLRTSVRVTRTRDGSVVWAGTRALPLLDLPIVARLIAQEIVTRLGARLTTPAPRPVPERSAEVYELILRGSYQRSRYSPDDLEHAIGFFDQALRLDPSSERAHDLRETAQLRLLTWGGSGGVVENRLMSSGMIRRVLDRDRDESERLIDEADGELHDGEYAHACKLLNAAIDNDARSAPAYALRSLIRTRAGQVREAFADAETVTQLGRPLWGNALRAIALQRASDPERARDEAKQLLQTMRARRGAIPFWDARLVAIALAQTGDPNGARALLARVSAQDPRLASMRSDPSLTPAAVFRSPRPR